MAHTTETEKAMTTTRETVIRPSALPSAPAAIFAVLEGFAIAGTITAPVRPSPARG
jgi:hypothetical protein